MLRYALKAEKRQILSCLQKTWSTALQLDSNVAFISIFKFTNVPHTSLGNIEKQWFSIVGKKKKKEKDEKAPKEEGSTKESPPPTEGKPSSSGSIPTQESNTAATTSENIQGSGKIDTQKPASETESAAPNSGNSDSNGQRSAAVSLSQDAPSDPAPTPHSLSSSGAQDVQPPTNPSEPATTVVVTDSGAAAAAGTPSSSTGFGALHSSFDLDFGMTLNPALTAQPLEESPFSDTASGGPQTLTIPSPSPIVAQASPSEASPFE